MQNRKNGRRSSKKNMVYGKKREDVFIEDFFGDDEDGFDEEDEDRVTEDTLEFLCLDDEMIEAYNRKHGRAERGDRLQTGSNDGEYAEDEYEDDEYAEDEYEDDEYAEDEYEDDEYAEDEYEDDEYAEDEYEDDEYADDEYEEGEYDAYEEDGVIVRLKYFLAHMNALDMVVAMLGVVVLAGALLAGGLYVNAKSVEKQVEAFALVGEEMSGISVIGESGLVAVTESVRLSGMIGLEEDKEEVEVSGEEGADKKDKTIEVGLNLTSIQSDLKIKFVNKATGKLIGGVPFEVEVAGSKSYTLKDEDKDGIIYQTGIAAGDYSVKILPLADDKFASYVLPSSASNVKVSDKITYKKVDVADEVKSESEVNAAAEDTAKQNTAVESALTDTVEWVESTKTPIGEGQAVYTEVDKKNIPDPWTVSSNYRKMAAVEEPSDPVEFSVALDHGSLTLKPGETAALKVSVNGSSATPYIVWSSSNTGVASVDSSGNVSGVGAGDATIKVEVTIGYMIEEATCSVKVTAEGEKPADPSNPSKPEDPSKPDKPEDSVKTKVELNTTSLELEKGESASLSVKVVSGEMKSVEWSSSDKAVAKVDQGKVTAVGVGSAKITARVKTADGEQELVCSVTVEEEQHLQLYEKISISGEAEVVIGRTITLTAKTEPEGGKAVWSSSDETKAKVDGKGVVTGVAEGTVEIKAVCNTDEDISAVHKITVKKETAVDGKAKLKDKDGNQMYYLDSAGAYQEAVYDDYRKYEKFYKKSTEAAAYKYTGWQTIDGSVYFYDKNGNYVTGDQVIQGARYHFGSDGKMSSASGTMGIDVSKWNGSIDWNAVKNSGVSYAIIRCGYRGSSTGALIEDPKFRSNIKGAKAAGLKVGVYFFSQAVNEVEAVEEASMALNLVSGYGLNYPIFLDVEASGGRGDGVSREVRTAVCRAFCATVQNSGYSAGIYANKTWFSEKINTGSLTNYKIWLAQYASAPTYTATRYDMWQYSAKGKVSGIKGDVDMNISYLHY
ncbi:MAG: Ig-like domain-containing protein [Lachnospiraceae bacterium]|nr:Ig-like domain-containing protein [Lachnospiraceae bacterium]